jgi:serine/threonine protein kinase
VRQPVPFGKYLLLDRISVGGMAEVFKAKSYGVEGFEKIIAIKRILPTMGEDRDFIKMFIDEAKIAGQLAHANICQIFELGRIDGSHFIAMEYIWGKDLLQIQNRLRKIKQPMPVAMACFTIAKVLEGLDYAHRKRDPLGRPLEIVHRDCSPQNVLVSYEGEVKVIDFGIAKATSRNSRTMAGVLKGKFGYMSPEQVRGLPLDRRSDLFALGTMLYECLTSERLFQGETDFSTLEKVRNVDIRPPRELNPAIPEAVERVILKALAKDVDDRYQWCSEMLADLQQFLMGQEIVFTAKSLSSWLKEVFSTEIDKERALLEQYKRVGRDGLFQGLPSAEAKLDVVETLGEAPPVEGDPTILGGPNFDDIEQAVAASALEVGPAPGSPAARGAAAPNGRAVSRSDDDADGDFGEEAPTEIFGEIDHGAKPGVIPTPVPAPVPMAARPGTSSQPPRPPTKAPTTGRPATRPSDPPQQYSMAANSEKTMNVSDADLIPTTANPYAQNYPGLANQQQPYGAQGYPQQQQYPNGYGNYAPPMGTPSSVPMQQPLNALAAPGQAAGKTLMGAAAPPGLPNYSNPSIPPQYGSGPQQQMYPGYPPQYPQQQHPSQPMSMHPSQQHGMHPSQPQMHGYPSAQGYMQQMPGGGQMPYGQPNQYQTGPAVAMDQAPVEGRKKSSIGRDVAIGVAIAAVVLGGFLLVKFFVLDSDDDTPSTDTGKKEIATLRIEMPPNLTAELFLDDAKEKHAIIKNTDEIPVTAGLRKVKILAPNGQRCEQELKLPAGVTTTVKCIMHATAGSGSAAETGSGSAVAGSGSATDTKTPDTKTPDTKAPDTKAPDTKAPDTKAPDTKAPDTKTPDTKTADTKTPDKTSDKTPDKALVKTPDKTPIKTADKTPDKTPIKVPDKTPIKTPIKTPDKLPPEDNPADKAAALSSKGFLSVTSNPSAKISVDGVEVGQSPIKVPTTPGKHKVMFTLGTDKFAFPVIVKAGETTNFHKELK